jgi:hypothetical protein
MMLVFQQMVEVMLVYQQMVEVMLVDVKQQDEGMHVDINQHNHQIHHHNYYLLQYLKLHGVLVHLYQHLMVELYTKEVLIELN